MVKVYVFPNPAGGVMTILANSPGEALGQARQAGWKPTMGSFGTYSTVGVPTGTGSLRHPGVSRPGDSGRDEAAENATAQAYNASLAQDGDDERAFARAVQDEAQEMARARLGLEALSFAAGLQADPFRQQQALFGLGANPYLSGAVGAVAGKFTAPTNGALTAGIHPRETVDSLAGRMGGQTGTPDDLAAAAAAFPASNKVVGRAFLTLDPASQRYVVSGLREKEGLDQDVILDRIKKGLPRFTAPRFGGVRS